MTEELENALMRKLQKFIDDNLNELHALAESWLKDGVLTAMPKGVEMAYKGYVLKKNVIVKIPFNWVRKVPLIYLVVALLVIKDGARKNLNFEKIMYVLRG